MIVSAQGSHRETPSGAVWGSDCGLCAIKNVTVDATLTLSNLLAVVRPLQEKKVGGGADFLDEGNGDFNGQGLVAFLEENGYQCAFGRGHLIELLEMLCLTPIGARFMGVVWHVPGEPQHDFTEQSEHTTHLASCCCAGHWLGASYEHSSRPFAERRWSP